MNRVRTSIKELDEILQGGIPAGSTVLVVGRPGTGKTILAHQVVFNNASPDNKVVYFTTLSEPQIKILKFQQQFTFFNFDKVQNSVIYRDLGSVLHYRGPSAALQEIDNALKEHRPGLIVIDTIKTMADMIPVFIEFRQFLLDISVRLAAWGCTGLLLGEYSEEEIDVRPESSIVDGIIYLYGPEEHKLQKRYLRILKMRGTGHVHGENVFTISKRGIEIFPRLQPLVDKQHYEEFSERLSTGIPKLDEMTGGGIPRSSTTLLSGASGTGKTILALNFTYSGLLKNEKVVYVSFEENPRQITAGARGLGMDLQLYINSGNLCLMYVAPIELDVDEHVYRIQKLVQGTAANRLVIDSISSFELGMEDKVKYTDHIWRLCDYFKSRGVTVLLTHEMFDPDKNAKLTKYGISFIADNLLMLRYLERGSDVRRYLRVVKMRGTCHSQTMKEIRIDGNGLQIL